ncbi:MAG: hypothetical protein U1E57_02595 [Paenacidovorax caeni]
MPQALHHRRPNRPIRRAMRRWRAAWCWSSTTTPACIDLGDVLHHWGCTAVAAEDVQDALAALASPWCPI